MTKKNKYGNKKCKAFGMTFDSVGERDRAFYLMEALSQGLIRELRFQTPFKLVVNDQLICKYIADFVYEKRIGKGYRDKNIFIKDISDDCCLWIRVVEDFKGFKTPTFKLKEKLMKACHGIEVKIVKVPSMKI